MAIIRAAHERDFTIITNAVLRDTNLSLKAKGLLALMLSEFHDQGAFDQVQRGRGRCCRHRQRT